MGDLVENKRVDPNMTMGKLSYTAGCDEIRSLPTGTSLRPTLQAIGSVAPLKPSLGPEIIITYTYHIKLQEVDELDFLSMANFEKILILENLILPTRSEIRSDQSVNY